MKLYATVTSERGKPTGKGGNEYLRVSLLVGSVSSQIDAGTLTLEVVGKSKVLLSYIPPLGGDTVQLANIAID